jgi:hypothetical protein
MNHGKYSIIQGAFVVDSQYNPSTRAVECMIYVPDDIRTKISNGVISKVSVEYVWRSVNKTSLGSEFVGLVFDRIALLEGYEAGDKLSEIRKCESKDPMQLASFEGVIEPHESKIKQDSIQSGCVDNPEQGFYCKNKECETYKLSIASPDAKVKAQIVENTNVMGNKDGGAGMISQTSIDNTRPANNVNGLGQIKIEGSALEDSTPVKTSNEINVINMVGDRKLESIQEPKKEEPKVIEEKKADVVPVIVPEVAKFPDKPLEIPKEPIAPKEPEIDYKTKFESVSKHEQELEGAIKRLQDTAKVSDADRIKKEQEAFNKGKQLVIDRVSDVLPVSSVFSYNIQGMARTLVTDVKKRLYECEKT